MRKIAQPGPAHNARPGAALLAALLVAALAGCNGTGSNQRQDVHPARQCPLIVDTSGLSTFYGLADRVARGKDTTAARMAAALADLPVWKQWRASHEPTVISPEQFGLMLQVGLRGRASLTREEERKPFRREVGPNLAWDLEHRAEIEAFVAAFIAGEKGCEILPRARDWIPAAALPDTLHLAFLAGGAEIRRYQGRFLIDGAIAATSGADQLVRLLTSILYRELGATTGPSPDELAGEAQLGQTLRVLRNEGIAACIEDVPNLFFGRDHPTLSKGGPAAEELSRTAVRNLRRIEQAVAARNFPVVHGILRGGGGWQATGWFMATLIGERLGEPRLHATTRSVRDFLGAYQEAALASPATHFGQTPPAFSPEVLAVLQAAVPD